MSENLINIYNLRYHTVVLKKMLKLLQIALLGPYLGKKLGQQRPCPKSSSIFFLEITKGDHKLSRTFYFIKNHNF